MFMLNTESLFGVNAYTDNSINNVMIEIIYPILGYD